MGVDGPPAGEAARGTYGAPRGGRAHTHGVRRAMFVGGGSASPQLQGCATRVCILANAGGGMCAGAVLHAPGVCVGIATLRRKNPGVMPGRRVSFAGVMPDCDARSGHFRAAVGELCR